MARRLHCYVAGNQENTITDTEWEQIRKLQHWYSSEFIWTAGKPALKMFAVFPNLDHPLADDNLLMDYISDRWNALSGTGLTENEILRKMRDEKLILLKEGGYHDGCLISGSVRVANNEWNAYLFTELILKASLLAPAAEFELHDEGEFIRWRPVYLKNGAVLLRLRSQQQYSRVKRIVEQNNLFAHINSHEYDNHPDYRTLVTGFPKMEREERQDVLKNWNWHGYNSIMQNDGNDTPMYDLTTKVKEIHLSLI
jgi:hypothetical protein